MVLPTMDIVSLVPDLPTYRLGVVETLKLLRALNARSFGLLRSLPPSFGLSVGLDAFGLESSLAAFGLVEGLN